MVQRHLNIVRKMGQVEIEETVGLHELQLNWCTRVVSPSFLPHLTCLSAHLRPSQVGQFFHARMLQSLGRFDHPELPGALADLLQPA